LKIISYKYTYNADFLNMESAHR